MRAICLAVVVLSASASGALALEPGRAVSVEGEIGVVSDYRFRGVSLSDDDPAVQGGLTASLASGAYGSVWASTIDEYGAGADGKGATVELDYTLGWALEAGGYDIDVAASLYTYPGGTGVSYVELPVSISRQVGPWAWTLGGAYAPSQSNLGDKDNSYGYGKAHWTATDDAFWLEGQAGYEHGAYAPDGKWDWSATVGKTLGPVEASLSYVGVEGAYGSDTVVASLKAAF